MNKNKVLVPVDDSEFSLQVLPYVTRFLPPAQNELILLHIASMPEPVAMGTTIYVYADQEAASVEAECMAELYPYVQSLEAQGYTVTPVVRFGETTGEIERYIENEQIDLVAMTTHGRTGLARVWLGSVAQHVVSHLNVPILLYHAPTEDDESGALGH